MANPPFNAEAGSRLLPLDGCHNFRAVSGWRTGDGRRLAPGRLFRADGLDRLSDADHARLAVPGIGHVFDLRAAAEIGHAPSRWPAGSKPRTWSGAESAAEADITAIMTREGLGADAFAAAMHQVYARFPDDLAGAVAALGEAIIAGQAGAALVHCTAGKDRTGFAIAMLLHAIGVHADDVMDDYLLSNASYAAALARFNLNGRLDAIEARAPGAVAALVGAHPGYLATAQHRIAADFGSLDAWLSRRAGLDAARREQLAERLLG